MIVMEKIQIWEVNFMCHHEGIPMSSQFSRRHVLIMSMKTYMIQMQTSIQVYNKLPQSMRKWKSCHPEDQILSLIWRRSKLQTPLWTYLVCTLMSTWVKTVKITTTTNSKQITFLHSNHLLHHLHLLHQFLVQFLLQHFSVSCKHRFLLYSLHN